DEPPGEPSRPTRRPSRSRIRAGDMDDRGRLPAATALAAGVPSDAVGTMEKSGSWLFRKKPPAIRPEPNRLSTVVVRLTALPCAATTTRCDVPAGSRVASAPTFGAPAGTP